MDEAIHNGILHAFKHMARNKQKKVLKETGFRSYWKSYVAVSLFVQIVILI